MSLIPSLFAGDLFDAPIYGTLLSAPQARHMQQLQTAMNIDEDDKSYSVHVDLPGFAPSEVNMDFEAQSQVLTIKAAKSESKEGPNKKTQHTRRSFTRSFTLPQDANADAISANLENGVLTVVLPKRAPPAPRKISITSQAQKAQIGAAHTTQQQEGAQA